LIPTSERSGLLARIATMESVSLCASMINRLRFLNLNRRCDRAAHRAAGKVKPVYAKNTKWLLFNPNQLQKFAQ
jgi:hypothetical protein